MGYLRSASQRFTVVQISIVSLIRCIGKLCWRGAYPFLLQVETFDLGFDPIVEWTAAPFPV